jgi:hypothetical protein
MSANQFSRVLALLQRLDEAKIPYTMEHSREDALMILAFAPGEYWEIEFLEDGRVDVERYRSDGRIHDESAVEQLFALWSEDENAVEAAPRRSTELGNA